MRSANADSLVTFMSKESNMKRPLMMLIGLRSPTMVRSENATALAHFDSEFCWCDPSDETDDDGQRILIHKEVTWN